MYKEMNIDTLNQQLLVKLYKDTITNNTKDDMGRKAPIEKKMGPT